MFGFWYDSSAECRSQRPIVLPGGHYRERAVQHELQNGRNTDFFVLALAEWWNLPFPMHFVCFVQRPLFLIGSVVLAC